MALERVELTQPISNVMCSQIMLLQNIKSLRLIQFSGDTNIEGQNRVQTFLTNEEHQWAVCCDPESILRGTN